MRTLLLTLLLAGCTTTSTPPAPPPGGPGGPPPVNAIDDFYNVSGTVVELDLDPMAYDGDAVVSVRRDDGEVVPVYIPARMNLCQADLSGFDGLEVGDEVEVVARMHGEGGGVRPCAEASEYFRRR